MTMSQSEAESLARRTEAGVESVSVHRSQYDQEVSVKYSADGTFNLGDLDAEMRSRGYELDGVSFRHRTVSWKESGGGGFL